MGLWVSLIEQGEEVYDANITHNLNTMANEAGLYEPLWHPESIGAIFAEDIIEYLGEGLEKMKADPDFFKKFDSPNGWGTYKYFVPFVGNYFSACKEFPKAEILADR